MSETTRSKRPRARAARAPPRGSRPISISRSGSRSSSFMKRQVSGSSSTTRIRGIRPLPSPPAGTRARSCLRPAGSRGRTVPPCASTTSRRIGSPRPVPLPGGLRGVERVEDLRELVGRDAGARVRHHAARRPTSWGRAASAQRARRRASRRRRCSRGSGAPARAARGRRRRRAGRGPPRARARSRGRRATGGRARRARTRARRARAAAGVSAGRRVRSSSDWTIVVTRAICSWIVASRAASGEPAGCSAFSSWT